MFHCTMLPYVAISYSNKQFQMWNEVARAMHQMRGLYNQSVNKVKLLLPFIQ